MLRAFLFLASCQLASALIPLIDGGKGMPKLYEGYFNDQIAKQAGSAVSRAISAGKVSKVALLEKYGVLSTTLSSSHCPLPLALAEKH